MLRSAVDPSFQIRGSGETAFIESIGGIEPSDGEGWLFKVDGEFAMQGVGSTKLTPPSKVRWSLGTFSDVSDE